MKLSIKHIGLSLLAGTAALVCAVSPAQAADPASNQPQYKYRIVSNEKLAAGKHTIKFDFQYDGTGYGKGGTGTLSVDGQQVAQGKIERTIPVRFSLDETFDVGEDTGTPVVEDYEAKMPFKFTGTLKQVVIELGKSGLTAADAPAIKEANQKLADVRD